MIPQSSYASAVLPQEAVRFSSVRQTRHSWQHGAPDFRLSAYRGARVQQMIVHPLRENADVPRTLTSAGEQ